MSKTQTDPTCQRCGKPADYWITRWERDANGQRVRGSKREEFFCRDHYRRANDRSSDRPSAYDLDAVGRRRKATR